MAPNVPSTEMPIYGDTIEIWPNPPHPLYWPTVMIPHWSGGRDTALDVTVVCPLLRDRLAKSAETPGYTPSPKPSTTNAGTPGKLARGRGQLVKLFRTFWKQEKKIVG